MVTRRPDSKVLGNDKADFHYNLLFTNRKLDSTKEPLIIIIFRTTETNKSWKSEYFYPWAFYFYVRTFCISCLSVQGYRWNQPTEIIPRAPVILNMFWILKQFPPTGSLKDSAYKHVLYRIQLSKVISCCCCCCCWWCCCCWFLFCFVLFCFVFKKRRGCSGLRYFFEHSSGGKQKRPKNKWPKKEMIQRYYLPANW